MSLIICPDCKHEVSTTATACPNCGHPFRSPVRNVVVANRPTGESGLPNWAFVLFGILGVLLLFAVFMFINRENNDELANRSVNVEVAGKRSAADNREKVPVTVQNVTPASEPQTVTVPSTSAPSSVNVPSSSGNIPTTTTTTTAPVEVPTKGIVSIDAKITTPKGVIQNVRAEKFYLLDKSLDTILDEADLEPIEGQTLTNSLGLAVLYPGRYGDFNRAALNAVKKHIKYNMLTDSSGKASVKDVTPNSYYLFGVTKAGNAFAVWDAPVTIQAGQNILNLSPQALTVVEAPIEEEE